jgi:hypothetical protein
MWDWSEIYFRLVMTIPGLDPGDGHDGADVTPRHSLYSILRL